jgi:hypothetical protein
MFKRKTLFVVGAGASKEVGLPDGSGLAAKIAEKLNIRFAAGEIVSGDADLYHQVSQKHPQDHQHYQPVARTIAGGLPLANSIDDYLDLHSDNAPLVRMGKVAIVKAVLEAERGSKLYIDRREQRPIDFTLLSPTWFVKFLKMLGRGVVKNNARQIFDSVSFIVFNYDRCVEHFLLHALQPLYGIQEQEAGQILSDLHIIHPYGLVGDLPLPSVRPGVPFGGDGLDSVENYVTLSDQIRTYTEQMTDGTMAAQIRQEVLDAECIVFLGFAYHAQNLNLLKPPDPIPQKPVFGTAFGMSDSDATVVRDQLLAFFAAVPAHGIRQDLVKIENKMICGALFDSYTKSLTGGD